MHKIAITFTKNISSAHTDAECLLFPQWIIENLRDTRVLMMYCSNLAVQVAVKEGRIPHDRIQINFYEHVDSPPRIIHFSQNGELDHYPPEFSIYSDLLFKLAFNETQTT